MEHVRDSLSLPNYPITDLEMVVDWFLYGKVVEASVGLLNSMATLCQGLIGINQSNMLHSFSPNDILDSK